MCHASSITALAHCCQARSPGRAPNRRHPSCAISSIVLASANKKRSHIRSLGRLLATIFSRSLALHTRRRSRRPRRVRLARSRWRSSHRRPAFPGARRPICSDAVLGSPGARRRVSREVRRAALHPSGDSRRSRPSAQEPRNRYPDRIRKNALLQLAGPQRHSRKHRYACALFVPNESSRARPACRTARPRHAPR